jgi:hypothetical protein
MNLMQALGGALTIIALVGLGIFAYPALLRRGWAGRITVAGSTLVLVGTFHYFDLAIGTRATTAVVFAVALALAPLAAGLIVYRLQRRQAIKS